jgi:hypothetical protein
MANALTSYDAPGHPQVSVLRIGDVLAVVVGSIDVSGPEPILANSISGLSPKRTPNEEEKAFGVASLNPPFGSTTLGEQRLIDIAVRAAQAAIESTGGLDAAGAIVVAQKVQHAVRGALALLPPVTGPTGIGTVYTP